MMMSWAPRMMSLVRSDLAVIKACHTTQRTYKQLPALCSDWNVYFSARTSQFGQKWSRTYKRMYNYSADLQTVACIALIPMCVFNSDESDWTDVISQNDDELSSHNDEFGPKWSRSYKSMSHYTADLQTVACIVFRLKCVFLSENQSVWTEVISHI
jgi:hypothetical protein